MTTPSSGPISAQHINTELGNPTTQQLSLNDTAVRTLAGVSSGTISYNDLRGKSSFTATGGNAVVTPGNGYKYHTFTSPGTFNASATVSIDILMVGSGGFGGPSAESNGGGGGAGGLIYIPNYSLSSGPMTVDIGTNGADTQFGTHRSNPDWLRAKGGGNGGGGPRYAQYAGTPGGSGGGGSGYEHDTAAGTGDQPGRPGNSGTYGHGYPGTAFGSWRGDGGGGAGATATTGSNQYNGNGGNGRQYPGFTGPLIGVPALAPHNGYFAGGGGSGYAGQGGLGGGGGHPSTQVSSPGDNGVDNTGGGGGGSWAQGTGGQGGSGIVVIRYSV